MAEDSRPDDRLGASWDRLRQSAPLTLAADCGAELLPDSNTLRLKVIDADCDLDLRSREMRYVVDQKADLSLHLRFLILHYVAGAGRAQVANRLATFREFEGGSIYYPVLKSRSIDPIVRVFGTAPEILSRTGEAIGAEPVKTGDVGFRVHVFPRLPMVVVLWLGDEEVPASANILFDASAGGILPTEDLAFAAETLVHRLIKIAVKQGAHEVADVRRAP